MHIKKKKNSKNIVFSLILSCYAISAYAVNLGDFNIFSGKNQPLKADLNLGELTETELRSLRLDFFSSDNVPLKDYEINTIIEKRGKNYVAKIISKKILPSNISDIKIQANVSGQVYEKIYSSTKETSKKSKPHEVADVIKATPLPSSKPADSSSHSKYGVKKGDTLYSISGEHSKKLENVSLDQVIVAIYQSNQQAFVNGNMNRLRSGSELALPSSEEAAQFDQKSAKLEIMARTTQYNKYRGKLSNFITKRASENSAATSQKGNVNTQTTGVVINNTTSDNLKITKANGNNASEVELANKLEQAEQSTIKSQQQALEDKQKNLNILKEQASSSVQSSSVVSSNIAQDERIKDPLGINSSNDNNTISGSSGNASEPVNNSLKVTTTNEVASQTKSDASKKTTPIWSFILILLGAGGIGFYIYKRRKQEQEHINEEYDSLFIPTKLNNTNKTLEATNNEFETQDFFNNSFSDISTKNSNDLESADSNLIDHNNSKTNNLNAQDDDHLFSDEIPLITDNILGTNANADIGNSEEQMAKEFNNNLESISQISEEIPTKKDVEQSINTSAFLQNNKVENEDINLNDIPTLSYDDILEETPDTPNLSDNNPNILQENSSNIDLKSQEKISQKTEDTNHSSASGFYDTKLELAKAYLDIEDFSGASMLLEDLATQSEDKKIQKQAKALLKDINSI